MKAKRFVSLLTALMVAGSALGATVHAEEAVYEQTDAYVLNYTGEDIEGYEDYSSKRLYASDHYAGLMVDEDENGTLESNWNWTCCSVLNMINTTKLAAGGAGAYASIPVYCVDAITDGVPGHDYRRVNLEDSGYFTDTTAGRIRAVFLHSFPYVTDMDALANAVNGWSRGAYADVAQLQESEAITATQIAIWDLANRAEVYAPCLGTGGYYQESEMVGANLEVFRQGKTDHTKNNIEALYAYLMALEPMAPRDSVISDEAFGEITVEYAEEAGGTYTATVTAAVTAQVDEADDLVLTAVCGGQVSEPQALENGTRAYRFTFGGLTATEAITVHIDGHQDAADVFLFDPVNGREASQTMAGYDSSSLPVHAEAAAAPRILNLTKRGTITETTETVYLENVRFEIYHVGSLEDYANGRLVLSNPPQVSEAELAEFVNEAHYVATITTDENGRASYNFTLNGQPDGIYIIKELHHEATTGPMAPFYLEVPRTDETGSLVTTIEISPKNTVRCEDIEIEKDVTDIDNEHSSYDVGEHHTWIIQSSIPEGLGMGLKYAVTDTLDERLTLVSVDRVAIAGDSGTFGSSEAPGYVQDGNETPAFSEDELLLEEGLHYSIRIDKTEDGRDHFAVELTPAGMAYAAEQVGEAYGDHELRVYFTAFLNTKADMDAPIPNQAHVDYTNNLGLDYDADSDLPDVITGAGQFLKVDAGDHEKLLAGAAFLVYRPAREGDTGVETIDVGGEAVEVVKAGFYDNAELTGEKVWEVITDENGKGVLCGLAYGTYYLVETKAPVGYNLLTEPVEMTICQGSSADAVEVTICNSSRFQLPETGGIGTTVFTFGGAGLIGAAVLSLLAGRKKRA